MPREGRITLPDMSGQLAEEVAGLVSMSGYLALSANSDGEEERVLLMRNYPKYRVKARTKWGGDVPDELVEPTIGELLDILGYSENGGKKKKKRRD
jgi:hypothetical protein